MRSQALIQRSRLLLKGSRVPFTRSIFPSSSRPSRKDQVLPPSVSGKRLSSSTPISANEPPLLESPSDGPEPPPNAANPPESPPPDEPEKPKRKTKAIPKDPEIPLELPEGLVLEILWRPESDPGPSNSEALPPPEIFDEALHNLHITLHPQTQHRATYPSPIGPLLEPTLALYCPIEGGEYVVDATVRELARRTNAEVLVLDAVQLAAGEWGAFGKAANSLQLPRNPLHFRSSHPSSASNSRPFSPDEDDDESELASSPFSPTQMTLTLLSPQSGRALLTSPSRRNGPPSKIKVFFETVVNTPSPDEQPEQTGARPRLVYIRDFPTLAPSSSAWYPPLLSSVRSRRRRAMPRSTSPISHPMTIIFGMTPSLVPTGPPSSSGPATNASFKRMMTQRVMTSSRQFDTDWSEDDASEKAREKRLRERLRRWERGDSLQDEFPKLSAALEGESSGEQGSGIIIIGGPSAMLAHPNSGDFGNRDSGPELDSLFFRTSTLVPSVRSLVEERSCRVKRRREINELTTRMGVGAVGGVIEKESAAIAIPGSQEVIEDASPSSESPSTGSKDNMWEDWGNRIEVWSTVRAVADRAVGNAVATRGLTSNPEKPSLDATPVGWPAINGAWTAHRAARSLRKAWMKEASTSKPIREQDDEEDVTDEQGDEEMDEVVDRVKNDPDLDPHEQRLLSCIVNPASMPTSFNQVHLPAHTIDSVRTIVSLPLLHPQAFQQGILKEHGMTGCLLFGPPGTGKTLVVRALAKDAGCRMMAISPSDVMDMYVGEGEKLVKAVFSLARKIAPCVVFLDEIDALFGARVSGREGGGAVAHRAVLTEFMQEMDGLRSSKDDSVIVIGATNRPFDLDDAVLRRLPRRLLVDLPGEREREDFGSDLDPKSIAKKTESFSGSDLKHLCVSAALDAVKENVVVPWSSDAATLPVDSVESPSAVSSKESETSSIGSKDGDVPPPATAPRILHLRHFTKALKEITPSSSEVLGSLADLRKWNEQFGEGRGSKKRQQVWGKGRFGFTEKTSSSEDGRVLPTDAGQR
ncbi:hypothetical protein B0H10DRAFT_1982677 [Mycena sp. CBHHK59/15]|nr:hypothetical protein B0H10DRAFT_1982677 [Mycena sp. CBHHK59/15]